MKLNRRQLIQAVIVVVNHIRMESVSEFRRKSELSKKEIDSKLKELPIVKAAVKLMELETPAYEVSTDSRHIHIRERSSDWDRSEIKLRIPREFKGQSLPKYDPLVILGVKIEGDWIPNLRRQIGVQIDAVEVSSLLSDKKFTLNLQDFLTQIGISTDLSKLNIQSEVTRLTNK